MPEFNGFAKVVYKLMIPMIILFSITIVPFRLAQAENSFDYGSSKIFNETTKLGSDTVKIEDKFGKSNTLVLMVPRCDFATETKLSNELKEIEQVSF